MIEVGREEVLGLTPMAVGLVGFVYGAILYFRGLTGFWPTVFLIGGGVLGFVAAGYLLVLYHAQVSVGLAD